MWTKPRPTENANSVSSIVTDQSTPWPLRWRPAAAAQERRYRLEGALEVRAGGPWAIVEAIRRVPGGRGGPAAPRCGGKPMRAVAEDAGDRLEVVLEVQTGGPERGAGSGR